MRNEKDERGHRKGISLSLCLVFRTMHVAVGKIVDSA